MSTLVMVHGFMGGSAQWEDQRAALSDAFDVVTVDLPGFGANAHMPAINSIGGFADWVIAHLRAQGIERYHLLGHSMGGMIVQDMVRKEADRIDSLILYATGAVGVLPGRFETIAQSTARALADGPAATARRIAATWFLENEQATGFAPCAEIAEQAGIEAILAGLDAMEAWSGTDALSDIAAETLVIWGDRDRTYAWAQTYMLWTAIRQASLAVVPGCAHAVHLEKSDMFNAILRDFLTR
ncbi:alpha/beta fold hydrolase [Tateyamaria armeniaca]|uniref:Alpha/beta fold hydrolase n=1 Tax=Tateyamaria armeniaca TaxID=2518930 RepID=A0ABW8USU9_9RHOB